MVRQKVLAVLFCGFVAAQQIAQEYPQQQGQPANIAVNLPPVAPARNSVPPAPINAQGQPDAAGNPQIPVKQIPSHDQNQIPPQPQVPQYQNIPQNSQAQQKSVTPQPLPGAGAPRGMPVNQQHHQMQRNHIPQQPIAAHPEAANIPPAQMAQIPLQQHQGQQMGIPQGQQIYPPGNVGGVGHAAIPPQMQPPLHPAQMAAMQAAYQNAGSQQHPLYGNDSRVGPIAPHEMNVDQIRQLEAAEGLYPNGGLPENGAGDTAAQWEAMMADFVPDMIVTFKLSGGSTEHFHQEVGPEATLIRGGFFESMTENGAAVSFTVISPSGKVAYTSKAGEGIFKFETKEPGQYTFAVHNAGWMGAKYVTFVVGAGVAEALTQEDVESLDGNVKMLYRMLYDMETHASYTWRRMKSHLEGMHAVARHTYYALLVQLVVTGLATVVQLNIIKRMVSHRRMF